MLDHEAAVFALRTQLLTLAIPTTGSTSLSATSTGYARAAGSFLTDGFRPGMEITAASGFSVSGNNISNAQGRVITAVTASAISCTGCATDAASSGRTLTVGVPFCRAWENVDFTPVDGFPFIEEDYIPGPVVQPTLGVTGWINAEPMYVIKWYGLPNTGREAVARSVTELLKVFYPKAAFTLSTGDVLRVRTDPAPFAGQLLNQPSRRAVCAVTIPLRGYSQNVA